MEAYRRRLWAISAMLAATSFPATAQSVISTHSGVVYFFEGNVSLNGQRLEQSFGRFPDMGNAGELRTEHGRAEVLLTPGSFLRIGDSSDVRMLSSSLADTRVELVSGSAIVEAREAGDKEPRLIYKNWQVRLPRPGIYRVDSEPPQVIVHKGEAEVWADGSATPVAIAEGQVLPLQAVLLTESAAPDRPADALDQWAMGRSQAIYADSATAAEIFEDPPEVDPSGLAYGGFSRFPNTGIPSLGVGNPYGLSFWSPFQAGLTSAYVPIYQYAPLYPGINGLRGSRYSSWPGYSIAPPVRIGGQRPSFPGGYTAPRGPSAPVHAPPRVNPGHIGGHVGGHR